MVKIGEGKTETIKYRAIYVYLPLLEMVEDSIRRVRRATLAGWSFINAKVVEFETPEKVRAPGPNTIQHDKKFLHRLQTSKVVPRRERRETGRTKVENPHTNKRKSEDESREDRFAKNRFPHIIININAMSTCKL